MRDSFAFFVARRYLRARRKQAVISVITLISMIGVAAGVMALVVALAINNGFRSTLQKNLLGATAHVTVLEKTPGSGISSYGQLAARLRTLPHVASAAPSLYGEVLITGPSRRQGAVLKGVDLTDGPRVNEVLRHLKSGKLERLQDTKGLPGIILGSQLAANSGMLLDSVVSVINPEGELTPLGPRPTITRMRVVGLFESGFYELDANWAYTTLKQAQAVFSSGDIANAIEMRIDDINLAPQITQQVNAVVGKDLSATNWMEQNKPILNALSTERIVTFITISMIQLIAALNILIALIMMVMEKHKDIAILISMGARSRQVRQIFMLEGVIIGAIGTFFGLIFGYAICYFADTYRWIRLDEQVYSLSWVPFIPRYTDGLWIAAVALLVSFVATIYPARNASKIVPVEALRYE